MAAHNSEKQFDPESVDAWINHLLELQPHWMRISLDLLSKSQPELAMQVAQGCRIYKEYKFIKTLVTPQARLMELVHLYQEDQSIAMEVFKMLYPQTISSDEQYS